MKNVSFTGFSRIIANYPGEKRSVYAEADNSRHNDYLTLKSLPEKFIDPAHPERFHLQSFGTKKRQFFMLNGKLLDINHANKDTVNKVIKLLDHLKKQKLSERFTYFIDGTFLDKMLPHRNTPFKDFLRATGKAAKSVGKAFTNFIFR